MSAWHTFEWLPRVPAPAVFDYRGNVSTLDETFLSDMQVYESLIFCIGVVLLFSKERGRRAARLDWTRRWGVICTYVVLLLSAAEVLFIAALVMLGIAALFLNMPPKYQPPVTRLFVEVSAAYLRYGPYPKPASVIVLVASSSIAILLACIPLYDALRSSGPKWLAALLLPPLALFSLMNLAQAGRYCLGFSSLNLNDVYSFAFYFRPQLLVSHIAGRPSYEMIAFVPEAAKWCIVLAIAVWLSIARLAAWRKRTKASAASEP
jgi:hypothetical protein